MINLQIVYISLNNPSIAVSVVVCCCSLKDIGVSNNMVISYFSIKKIRELSSLQKGKGWSAT